MPDGIGEETAMPRPRRAGPPVPVATENAAAPGDGHAAAIRTPVPETSGRSRPPAMTDVAKLAGVSHQTVSRVLNNHPSVSTTTRTRVLAAIRQLDYRPNSAARMLVTGRSRTVGVITVPTGLYGPSSTLEGIQHAAEDAGYHVSVGSLRSKDRGSLQDIANSLVGHGVDGLLVIAPYVMTASVLADLRADVPIVAVEGNIDAGIPTAAVDQAAGARLAVEHLLDLGHDTVWHVSGPSDWTEARDRATAWRATLDNAGRDVPPVLSGDWTAASGYEAGNVLARLDEVRAIFVANDQMVLGVLRALHEHGRRVPEDVSIVGFDDIPEAEYFLPPLTTVKQDFTELGRRSVALLMECVRQGQGALESPEVVQPQLIVRSSTAPPTTPF